ncbi:hypothetical protein SAMN05421831_101150 [Allopseudospirillum japonicum]|uniref:Uncharacterized protein n=1 Tax=Allopseudospirillum japonicum TaxID=64971 RepID=A0A1H6QG29_9GAMM|nr:hypothetical protein [Allopseudospirillum japonicum]SEI38430.1 hypothetical protein SAMN05421831_101150 [Allopseudospirillum japonicum]
MTRRKKTRSLADRVNLKTGRKSDFKSLRQREAEKGDPAPLTRFALKKRKQRQQQAARKQARLQAAETKVTPS